MGATESRYQDERLQLPSPVHATFAGRRVLDPSTGRCAVCRNVFIPFARKKHYCRRCSGIICEPCSTMRRYRESDGWTFRVCRPCAARPTIFDIMRQDEEPWRTIMEFAGDQVQHRVLQICHRAQLGFYLPFDHGRWDDLFAEQTYLAKGANGAVYRTVLRPETLARLAAAAAAAASENEGGADGSGTLPSSSPVAQIADPMSLLSAAARGHVAVKVVQKSSIYSLRKWRHIERELMTLTRCRSPHVIELIGVFQSPEAVFIVMEYAQGGDLFDWLLARKKPTEAEVKNIAIQLLGTVFIMHERFGVVHRDIKPENILLRHKVRGSETPDLKFADFGFARHFGVRPMEGNAAIQQLLQSSSAAANAGPAAGALLAGRRTSGASHGGGASVFDRMLLKATPCGTLGFAPPETVKAYNARKEDPVQSAAAPHTPVDNLKKMDIFALGVTIAILLTGQEPFTCHSSRAHIDAVNRGVNFNSRPWAYVSPAARNLLRRMLAPEAKDRPTALQCLQSEWIADTNAAVEYVQQALALPVPPSVIPGGTVAMTVDPSKPQPRPSQLHSTTTASAISSGEPSPAAAVVVESPVDGGVISSSNGSNGPEVVSGPHGSSSGSPYKDAAADPYAAPPQYGHHQIRASSSSSHGAAASVDEPEDVVQSFQQSVRSLRQSRLSQQAHASTHVLVADGTSGRVGLRSRDDARAEEVDSEGGTAVNSGSSTASSSAVGGAGAAPSGGRPPIPLGPQAGGRTPARAPIPLAPQRK